jgi:hypothetical protein
LEKGKTLKKIMIGQAKFRLFDIQVMWALSGNPYFISSFSKRKMQLLQK